MQARGGLTLWLLAVCAMTACVDTDTDTDRIHSFIIARPWALLILGGGAARCGHLGGSHAHPHAHCPAVLSDGSDLSLSLRVHDTCTVEHLELETSI